MTHDAITISPGERFDVVVDFSGHPAGAEVTMVNTLGTGAARDVMRFRVRRRAADDSAIPKRLSRTAEPVDTPVDTAVDTAVATRVFDFRRTGQGAADPGRSTDAASGRGGRWPPRA